MTIPSTQLTDIYTRRFKDTEAYRNKVWQVLCRHFFSRFIKKTDAVLDLGCGYGEFINNIEAREKMAMDLNPVSRSKLDGNVSFYEQDCSKEWPIGNDTLDIVFTSNFFEHLPDKKCLDKTLQNCFKSLKKGGHLIALGPNIKYLPGLYWDFYDHHVILTDLSLSEALEIQGFKVRKAIPKFLPYTLVNSKQYPLYFLKLYLFMKFAWRIFGKQFLIVAQKT